MEENNSENQIIEEEEQIEVPVTKKDPKRVEQGKRLAAISREAKERKMRRKIMEEMDSKKPKINYKWWAIGGISFLTVLYLFYKSGKKKEEDFVIAPTVVRVKESPKKEVPQKFEEFD